MCVISAAAAGSAAAATAANVQLAIAIASTAVSIRSSQVAADAQADAQEQQAAAENRRLQQAETATRAREAQEAIATAQQVQDIELQSLKASDKARLAAIDGGLQESSISVQNLLQDFAAKEGGAKFALQQQTQFRGVAGFLARQDRILGSQQRQIEINKPIAPVDYYGAAANLAGSSMGIYTGALERNYMNQQIELNQRKLETGPTYV